MPVTFGRIRTSLGKPKPKTIKILLDSGASKTLVIASLIQKLRVTPAEARWSTMAGTFTTHGTTKIQFSMPEFFEKRLIEHEVHISKQLSNYDMIIGRDLLHEVGIDIKFSTKTMEWDDVSIPMKDIDATAESVCQIEDPPFITADTERMKRILDAKYEKANLEELVEKECKHLTEEERVALLELLHKYEELFDGTLGHWSGEDYNIELKPGVTPYHARPFPIPRAYEQTLRMEVERLCKIGVLKKVNRSEWAAPTFIIPKTDKTVRFISDFRELNKRIKRKPFPLPKIQDLMLKLEGFQFATSLDLNMGYYHVELSPFSKRLCTIVLPWGKYEYQRLPMGLCNSPDIFQEKMSTLMQDLEYVRAYIDDLLCITKGDWYDHLDKLEAVFQRLQQAGLKVNIKKSSFGKFELEYLGYLITRTSIEPISKKVKAILAIKPPKTIREVRRFVGMVNYYRDFWIRRSEILAPLTKLCSTKAKWEWGKEQQDAFDLMKKNMAREVQLTYPNFEEGFDIHTDASDTQLGAVISQKGRPIAFYSRKLHSAQKRYTTTERELLAIVETLKEFRNILLGQKLTIYTDHKNLTHKNFNTDRVMRWRLILEEYGPELIYLKGETNIVADALSRLDISTTKDVPTQESNMAECLGMDSDDLSDDAYPLTYKHIMQEQQKDKTLLADLKKNPRLTLKTYRGGGKERSLITFDEKIVIPQSLQQRTVQWYHQQLCHPGETRTEETIRQHYTWKNLRQHVKDICQKCHTCQTAKRSNKKYGLMPEKEAEAEPWDKLCVDLIGPYTLKRKGKQALKLWCVTMIDPATGWFEMKQISDKEATTIANKVEQTWLTRYPWPTMITYDQGTEFMAEFAAMVKNDYGIKPKGITKRNPQANAIIERIHQTIGNIIRTFEVQDNYLDEEDPWEGILAATMFAVRATYHTTLQATPSQLVFGRDAILNTQFEANWNLIRERKQRLIRKNNQAENAKRIPHTYHVGDKVLFREIEKAKYGSNPWSGPYVIRQVRNNGSVILQRGAIIEPINIRLIKPYKE